MYASWVGTHDERCGGNDGSDADQLEEVGSGRGGQVGDPCLVGFGLDSEVSDPSGERPHCLCGAGDASVSGRAPACTDVDDLGG